MWMWKEKGAQFDTDAMLSVSVSARHHHMCVHYVHGVYYMVTTTCAHYVHGVYYRVE